ncbi:MAG: hypothetical protein IPM26_17220 [Saprospiraceae bacterium]|nr:hypothetical protein [Saprospiraceae bacterium]
MESKHPYSALARTLVKKIPFRLLIFEPVGIIWSFVLKNTAFMSPHNNYRYLVLLIILGAGQVLSGQFGLRLKYNDARFSNWENASQ